MNALFKLRLRKLLYSLCKTGCWRPLMLGVAPSLEHKAILATVRFDLLLDVGANRGQFSLMARLIHPKAVVHAYEPLPGEAAVYERVMGRMGGVHLHRVALGAQLGEGTLHVSRRADSSSMLPIEDRQAELFPETEEVGTICVSVDTLDNLESHWTDAKRGLLKLDVQGFELSVLKGARRALKHCRWVYVECSHVVLYSGQALYPEIESFLAAEGFRAVRKANEQNDVSGTLIQADYLFERFTL